MDPLETRRLTPKGLEAFRDYLAQLGTDPAKEPPHALLTETRASEPVPTGRLVEPKTFGTQLDFARYADALFSDLTFEDIASDTGLWSWLSLYYFDPVCPPDGNRNRKPGRDYRHILEPGYHCGHRHLLLGPFMAYTVYGLGEKLSALLLYAPP